MQALSVWWLGLAPALWVQSATDCPDAAVVEAKLRETLGLGAEVPLEEGISIGREGEQLRVTARGKDERLLGERLLPAQGSCDELASAVAVVLATWISDEHPEYVAALPAAAAPSVASEAKPPEAPPPPPAPERPPAAAAPPADTRAPPPPPRAAASPPPRRFSLGAGIGAQASSGGAVPLGSVGARWMPQRWGLGAAAAAVVVGARTVELSTGSVRYFRWPLLLGPALRVPAGSAALDFHAGASVAWLRIEGVDFDGTNQNDAFAAGGFVSARASIGSGALLPFAELSALFWGPTEAFVRSGSSEPAVKLPQLEVIGVLGAAWQPH